MVLASSSNPNSTHTLGSGCLIMTSYEILSLEAKGGRRKYVLFPGYSYRTEVSGDFGQPSPFTATLQSRNQL